MELYRKFGRPHEEKKNNCISVFVYYYYYYIDIIGICNCILREMMKQAKGLILIPLSGFEHETYNSCKFWSWMNKN